MALPTDDASFSRVPPHTRRDALRLGALSVAALLLACRPRVETVAPDSDADAVVSVPPADATVPAEPVIATPKAYAEGITERVLLPRTRWATTLRISHSGVPGPIVMMLGGVHGDEPGAWAAADQIATWVPTSGSLLVIPRANVVAIEEGVRTTDELGDLNRLYPGNAKSKLPMARMAAAIVSVVREFKVQVLYDMHESWEFFAERGRNGNAFLGQTVNGGTGDNALLMARALVVRANQRITVEHDRMVARSEVPLPTVKQTNSLGIGRFVDGLTCMLVEMGQDEQEESRRTELHVLVARTFLESRSML